MHIFQFLHSLQLIPGYTSSVIHFLSSTQEVIAYWPNQSISRYVKQQRQECGGKEELVNSLDATTVTLNWEGNTIYTQSCGQISQISLHFSRCSVSLVIFLGQWLSSPPNGLGSHPPTLLQNESVVPASLLNIIVSKYMGRGDAGGVGCKTIKQSMPSNCPLHYAYTRRDSASHCLWILD